MRLPGFELGFGIPVLFMQPLGAGNREPGLGIPVMGRAIRDAAPPPAAAAPEFEVLTVFVGGRSPL